MIDQALQDNLVLDLPEEKEATFATDLYEVKRGVVSKDLLVHLDTEFELIKDVQYKVNGLDPNDPSLRNYFGDDQVRNSFAHYGAYCFESLSLQLKPIVEEVTQKLLHPTYSYARIYYTDAEMLIHKDRPSCQYSATFCIANNPEPWEIWFETLTGEHKAIYLEPGDMIVYKGTDLNHWRTPYKGKRQSQVFLHYVDVNGQYKDFKYDRRKYLGFPSVGKGPY